MIRHKFYYDPQKLSYEQIEITWKDRFKQGLIYSISCLFMGVIIFWISGAFFIPPREKSILKEKKEMEIQYSLLEKQIDEMREVVFDMQQRDDNLYRAIFQADPIPLNIRNGESIQIKYYDELMKKTNSDIVAEITHKTDILKKQIYIQSKSFDELIQAAKENETRLEYIPAIQPVLNQDLKRMASGYGWRVDPVYHIRKFHHGMDFSAPTGTDIYATGNATVSFSGWKSGYGKTIMLNHGYGYETLYAHLSKQLVEKGEKVTRGDIIALVGNTGKSTGPHLHYEVRYKGQPMNPQNYYFKDLSPEEYDRMVQMSNNAGQTLD